MSWTKPSIASVWKAVEIYMKSAHSAAPPAAVRERVDALKHTPETEFFDSPVFERDAQQTRYNLRLGNRFYPHMKLAIERSPDGGGHLFRADAHLAHIQPPPGSREAKPFAELVQMNQKIVEQIETQWDEAGLPTFKGYLRNDLARRRAQAGQAPTASPPS